MLTADCNLFICTCVHKHMCVQAFVSFPSIERSTGIKRKTQNLPKSVACTQTFPSVWIKDGNVKTALHYSVVSYSTILSEQTQSSEIASSRVSEKPPGISEKAEISTERMTAPQLSSKCFLIMLLVCFRPALSVFQWYLCEEDKCHWSFFFIKQFFYLCINNYFCDVAALNQTCGFAANVICYSVSVFASCLDSTVSRWLDWNYNSHTIDVILAVAFLHRKWTM